jgi:uncharacterized membrane protein YbhN (UPF0104 family)
VAALLLLLLARGVEWSALRSAIRGAAPLPLVGAFLVTLLFPVLNMFRWESVLLASGVRLGRYRVFEITMACWPVGTLTPGKAGEMLKAVAVPDKVMGLGTTIAERVVDVAILGLYGLIFGLLSAHPTATLGGLFGLAVAGGLVVGAYLVSRLPMIPPGIRSKLAALLTVFPLLLAKPRLLAACVLASALNWFLSMWQLQLLLSAFGVDVPITILMAVLPAATFAGLLPITPAGAGTRDAALLFLLAGTVDSAALLASSVVYTLYGYLFLGVAGLPFLWRLAPSGLKVVRSA